MQEHHNIIVKVNSGRILKENILLPNNMDLSTQSHLFIFKTLFQILLQKTPNQSPFMAHFFLLTSIPQISNSHESKQQ